jgi:uncharacterized protein YoxC
MPRLVNPQSLLVSIVLIAAIAVMGFVGVLIASEGDPQPTLLLLVGLMTPMTVQIVGMLKQQKNDTVTTDTNVKVDQLLNGALQGRIDTLEVGMADLKQSVDRIATKVDALSP